MSDVYPVVPTHYLLPASDKLTSFTVCTMVHLDDHIVIYLAKTDQVE